MPWIFDRHEFDRRLAAGALLSHALRLPLPHRGDRLTLRYRLLDASRVEVEGEWQGTTRSRQVVAASGQPAQATATGLRLAFACKNGERRMLLLRIEAREGGRE